VGKVSGLNVDAYNRHGIENGQWLLAMKRVMERILVEILEVEVYHYQVIT